MRRGAFVAELELILFKLSVIDLCQARCVCREWRRTIDDSSFRQGYAKSHRCIPHLCLLVNGSLFLKPAENSPRSEWRHFQTLPAPEDMTIASSDAGLLCLATYVGLNRQPSSIYVWRYSDVLSSPVRVPLPPDVCEWTVLVVYNRERDRSTPHFCVASLDRSSASFCVYDSARGEWSMREEECPGTGALMDDNAFYPVLDHGEAVVSCIDDWKIARYNLWDRSWRVFDIDCDVGSNCCLLQLDRDRFFVVTEEEEVLTVAEKRGDKWETLSCFDEFQDCFDELDFLLRSNMTCTDGSNSVWVSDNTTSRIARFDVDSKSWSVEAVPGVLRKGEARGYRALTWFSC